MAGPQGDIMLGDTISVLFCTVQSTGAPFALASGVISAYVDGGGTQITAGITLTADFDGVTGLNKVVVVATAANGFAMLTNVSLIITTGTVNSVSAVGYEVGSFSIQNRWAPGLICRGTAGAVTNTTNATIVLPTSVPFAQDGEAIGNVVQIMNGTAGVGQSKTITGYVTATRVATLDGVFATAPTGTILVAVLAGAPSTLASVLDGSFRGKSSGLTAGVGTMVVRNAADTANLGSIVIDANGNRTTNTWTP